MAIKKIHPGTPQRVIDKLNEVVEGVNGVDGDVSEAESDITSLGTRVTALENASGGGSYIIEITYTSPTDPPTITDGTQCDALAAAIASDDPIADVVIAMTVSGSVLYLHCDIASQTGPVLRHWTSTTDADIFTFAESDGAWSVTMDSIAYALT